MAVIISGKSTGASSTSLALKVPPTLIQGATWSKLVQKQATWAATKSSYATWLLLREALKPLEGAGVGGGSLTPHTGAPISGSSAGSGSGGLAVTVRTGVPLAPSAGAGAAALALTAPSRMSLGAANGVGDAALALTAPALLIGERTWEELRREQGSWKTVEETWLTWEELERWKPPLHAEGTSTTALALITTPQIRGVSAGAASTSLSLTAATLLGLTSAGTSTSALALHAPTLFVLATGGLSTTRLGIGAATGLALDPSTGASATGTITLILRTYIENRSWSALQRRKPTWAATEAEWATWAALLEGVWPIYADGVGQATLALHAPALLALASAGGSSTALHLGVSALLNLRSDGAATTALHLQAAAALVLHATGTSTTTLAVGWPRLKVRQGGAWVRGRVTPPMKIKSPSGWLPV